MASFSLRLPYFHRNTLPPLAFFYLRVAMPRFNASACAPPARVAKRPAEASGTTVSQAGSTRPRTVPKASDVVLVEQGPRPQRQPARLPTSAPVVVCVYLVSEAAADAWPSLYEGTLGTSVWQIQMEHAARPSVLFDQISAWGDFLKKAHAEDASTPASLSELTGQCGCKLVISDSSDPESVGFVQWRSAWYVAGDDTGAVDNMLSLIHEWLCYKAAQAGKDLPYEVRLHPHVGIQLSLADDYDAWVIEDQAATLPLSYFEAQPVVGKRCVTLHLEAVDGETVSVLLAGNTWCFRSRLDALGVAGAYHEEDGGKTYYRVMRNLSVNDRARLFDLLGDGCFKKFALRVVVDKEPDAGTGAAALFADLRELPQLHFVKAV